jgi:AraC-like DNA-binding protein
MEEIVPRLHRRDKRRLHRKVQRCRDARLRTRYLIILNLGDGISASETAQRLHVSRNTVYRVARRFREEGEAGSYCQMLCARGADQAAAWRMPSMNLSP